MNLRVRMFALFAMAALSLVPGPPRAVDGAVAARPVRAHAANRAASSAGQWRCWTEPLQLPCVGLLDLYAVTALSPTQAWAVGNVVLRWDGTAWSHVPTGMQQEMMAVDALSETDAWAVGYEGEAWHWDGAAWAKATTPTSATLNGVDMLSRTDGWAVGDAATILRWDGAHWSSVTSPVDAVFSGIAMRAPDDGWVVGMEDETAVVLHWDGSAWIVEQRFPDTVLMAVSAPAPRRVWLSGAAVSGGFDQNGLVVHWDGSRWSRQGLAANEFLHDIDMLGDSDGWAAGDHLYHWDGAAWTPVASAGEVAFIDVLSASDAWAVCDIVERWNGTSWTTVLESGSGYAPLALQMLSRESGWGVGEGGETWRWDGARWASLPIEQPPRLLDVDSVSRNEAWAVGEDGAVWHLADGAWRDAHGPEGLDALLAVDVVAPDDAWAVGRGGTAAHWDGRGWSAVPTTVRDDLLDVSFAAANDGWAVGTRTDPYEGFLIRWDGARWSAPLRTPTTDFGAVAMVSTVDGWAIGTQLLRWDGTSWSPFDDPRAEPARDSFVEAVAADDVWIGTNTGEGLFHWDGGTWMSYPEPAGITALAMGARDSGWASMYDPPTTWRWDGTQWSVVTVSEGMALEIVGLADSGSAAWAVGSGYSGVGGIVLEWDGRRWVEQVVSLSATRLTSLSMLSESDGWAVGEDPGAAMVPDQIPGVVLRWDGREWYQAGRPSDGFLAVDFVSPGLGWAGGWQGKIARWNGAGWTEVESAVPRNMVVVAIDAVTPSRAFAVAADLEDGEAVIVNWDGSEWGQSMRLGNSVLTDVHGLSERDAWVVGYTTSEPPMAVAKRWDGRWWQDTDAGTGYLNAVTALSADDVWAVGSDSAIRHWDGSRWRAVASPANADFSDIAMTSPGDGWITGFLGMYGGVWLRYSLAADVFGAFLPHVLRQ